MFSFILKSFVCLALLFAGYQFLLKKNKSFFFNRYYLIISFLFSFSVPLIKVEIPQYSKGKQHTPIEKFYVQKEKAIETPEIIKSQISIVNRKTSEECTLFVLAIIFAFILVSVVLFGRFLINIGTLLFTVYKSDKVKRKGFYIILTVQKAVPFSFFNYVFISKEDWQSGKFDQSLLYHEIGHVNKNHSIDILLVEIAQILFWFNPFVYLFKKAIKMNHEFEADAFVISKGIDKISYQTKLLDFAFRKNSIYLASSLNYSLTKKRLLMISKKDSNAVLKMLRITFSLTIFV